MTRDIDVVIDCSADQAAELARSFQGGSYASEDAARDAVETGTMCNVIHNDTLFEVDLMIGRQGALRREQFSRRRRIQLDGVSAWFISPENLFLARLLWRRASGSDQQRRDVSAILASSSDLDRRYLAAWAARLGVATELEEAGRA
jgi:hypothetical protein